MDEKKIKILHIITTLNTGGAEMMLYRLLSCLDRATFDTKVVSLTDIGSVGRKIVALKVPVRKLGMCRGVPDPLSILQLSHWLRQDLPHAIHTWMYHADLIGGLAAKCAGGIPVVWGIHNSNFDPQGTKRSTVWTAKTCARLSRWLPAYIVCCSEVSRLVHTKLGYVADKMVVIPNGFDLDIYRPNPEARLAVRKELGVPEDAVLIGLVGRFDPQKDHRNFIQSASWLYDRMPNVHFLLCGAGVSWENSELAGWIESAGIRSCCHLLGQREDVPRLFAAMDIASSSSSFGESFPLVVGEAMACEVPCVVTDVGDSAFIVGDAGKVVPPKNPQALAEAWLELIYLGREARERLGMAARSRIMKKFNLPNIVAQYEKLYTELTV